MLLLALVLTSLPAAHGQLDWPIMKSLDPSFSTAGRAGQVGVSTAGQRADSHHWSTAQVPTLGGTNGAGTSTTPRRIRVFPRSSVRWQARWFPSPDGRERIGVIDSGVNIIIDQFGGFDTIDISTDRMVIWTANDQAVPVDEAEGSLSDAPLEFYLEGNIVFRQGDRVIYANRMYYNVQQERGMVLDAEMLTPAPGFQGLLRLKADVLRQVDRFRFEGTTGALTSSRLGVPTYWLQSGRFSYQDVPDPSSVNSSFDPLTGERVDQRHRRVISKNNAIFFMGVPVFWWPTLTVDLDRPVYYLESASFNQDDIFGTQVLTRWNMYQILGFEEIPTGTNWTASVDYLSERGLGLGTHFLYDRPQVLGIAGRARGFLDAWGIDDSGTDNLGARRRSLTPEETLRGRVLGRHRQQLQDGYRNEAELGIISDRNFLEQYYEQEWDEEKDQVTRAAFGRQIENRSWSVSGSARVNDFFTQTEWLPRGDHYWIGQPLLSEWVNWHEHSSLGYARLRTATPPLDPTDAARFDLLAWESDREGLRGLTRHELNMPLTAGPLRIVPYGGGEAGYWQEELTGNDATRLLGQLGVRTSLPLWRAYPTVRSSLLNLNGLAHKVVLSSDLFLATSDVDMTSLPLYDPLDDDAIEFFRRRFFFDTFGGTMGGDVPLRFDERTFALRSGMQRYVSSTSPEIADDLTVLRMNLLQRWQTKRGRPGQQRIVDWLTLNTGGSFYPKEERDNFGESVGLLQYDLRWHLGDRFTVFSDGHADLFADGLRTVSVGSLLSRPGHSRYLVGIRSIEGPLSSRILYGAASYRLSEKWIANYGSSVDLGGTGNIGQRGQVVRVGESFLVGLGFHYDNSRKNFGVRFAIEPRIMAGKLSRVGGIPIAPVGTMGLE